MASVTGRKGSSLEAQTACGVLASAGLAQSAVSGVCSKICSVRAVRQVCHIVSVAATRLVEFKVSRTLLGWYVSSVSFLVYLTGYARGQV